MVRLNFFVILGGFLVLAGAFIALVGVSEGGLYGLIGAAGIFGATLPSILTMILGLALIKVGTRPKGFVQRKHAKARHQKS
jgi:hypothetical protein